MKIKIITAIILSVITTFANAEIKTGVVAEARASSCIAREDCIVASNHWASVINDSGIGQVYYVSYRICPEAGNCKSETYRIPVGIGTWSDGKIMTTVTKARYRGDFLLTAETILSDANHRVLKTTTAKATILVHG